MIKLVYCIRKNPSLSDEEFRDYWLNSHGPLVKSFSSAHKTIRYVQSHVVHPEVNAMLVETRGSSQPYDGITEVWWESLEVMQSALSTPEGQQANIALFTDEQKFIDVASSVVFVTEEHEIFDNNKGL